MSKANNYLRAIKLYQDEEPNRQEVEQLKEIDKFLNETDKKK